MDAGVSGSPPPEERQRAGRKPKELVHDAEGCSLCGVHMSSSFRTDPLSKQRMCNACHCRVYRLKRRAAEEAAAASGSRRRTPSQQALQPASSEQTLPAQECGGGGLAGSSDGDTATGRWPAALPDPAAGAAAAAAALQSAEAVAAAVAAAAVQQQTAQQQAQQLAQQQRSSGSTAGAHSGQSSHELSALLAVHHQQHHMLADLVALQQRALADAPSPRLLLACARRARLTARSGPEQRVLLGLLPSLRLRLPEDPPGLLHSVACLLEAVAPCPEAEGEQGADSCEGAALLGTLGLGGAARGGASGEAAAGGGRREVVMRTTVFAAAGAVACRHEAPPMADTCLAFCPLTKAPTWTSGPGGFTLHFPSAYDSQVDLMAAAHRYVALLGPAALAQAALSLEDPGPGLAAQAQQAQQQQAYQKQQQQQQQQQRQQDEALAAQQAQLAAQLVAAEQQQAQLAAAQQAQLLLQAEVVDDPGQHSLLGGLPLQLTFGPVHSGPLGSPGDTHALAFFDY